MKILVLVSELPPARSGVALSAGQLIELTRERGHEVEAIEMRRLPKLLWRELRLSFVFLRFRSLRESLRDYDAVHVHGPAPTFSDVLLWLFGRSGAPRPALVYTHHFELDLRGLRFACRVYERLHARIARRADAVVVTSRAYQRRLLERGLTDVSVIPWGADHRSTPPARRDGSRLDVLAVAQLRPYKGLDVLLRAFTKVPEARLHVVGEGHRRERLEALARRLGLEGARFHGALQDPELNALFATSHVIVLPSVSRMEAFGLSLLEGMRAGCVPVASELPGVAEVVGDAGILVPPGEVDALAEALLRLRRDRALLERLSERAIRRAAAYRWERTAAGYVALFERLAARQESRQEPLLAVTPLRPPPEPPALRPDRE